MCVEYIADANDHKLFFRKVAAPHKLLEEKKKKKKLPSILLACIFGVRKHLTKVCVGSDNKYIYN